jgi:hypothetical protein
MATLLLRSSLLDPPGQHRLCWLVQKRVARLALSYVRGLILPLRASGKALVARFGLRLMSDACGTSLEARKMK